MITYSKALLLTALGVMFCSGCTTERRLELRLGASEGSVSVNEQGEVSRVILNNTQITDAGLVHLKGLTRLGVLYLENTQITDAGVAKFKEALPGHESRAGETGGFGVRGFGGGGLTIHR